MTLDVTARLGSMGGRSLQITVPLALCLAWEVGVRALDVEPRILPPPSMILGEIAAKSSLLARHGTTTVAAVLLGFAASAVVGVVAGAFLVSYRWLDRIVFPLLVVSQTVPKIVIAPLLLIWVGNGLQLKLLVTFLMAFFPVLVDTMVGFRAMPPELMLLARSMGASRLTVFRRFRLPYALPYIFGGLRVAAVFAVSGTVVAEFVGADTGWVYLMVVGQTQHQTPLVFAIVVLLSALSLMLFGAVEMIERRAIPSYRRMRDLG